MKAIAAMAENRVIGNQGKIPWHLPEDFKWFKQVTMGGVLVMGRRTYESIGRPLPGRETWVLSRSGFSVPGTRTVRSVEELLELAKSESRQIWVAGGAEVYKWLLPFCGELYLTKVDGSPAGDAYFPVFEAGFYPVSEVLRRDGFHVMHYHVGPGE